VRAVRGVRGEHLSVLLLSALGTQEAVKFTERDLAVLVVVDDREEAVELVVGVVQMQSTEELSDVSLVEVTLVSVVDGVEESLQHLGNVTERERERGRGEREIRPPAEEDR
jgi:ribosome maturation protein Sdo1